MTEQSKENLNIGQSPDVNRPIPASERAEFEAWKNSKEAAKRPTPDSGGSRIETSLTDADLLTRTESQTIDPKLKKAFAASEHPQGKLQGFLRVLNGDASFNAHDLQDSANDAGVEEENQ